MQRTHKAGFSLIELMMAMGIGMFLVVAAMVFTGDNIRLLSVTEDRVEMNRGSRQILDLLARDLRNAGVGVGLTETGAFAGMDRSPFTVAGGATFTPLDHSLTSAAGTWTTDDIGLHIANGDYRTLADFTGVNAQVCSGGNFAVGDIVTFTSREGMFTQSLKLTGVSASGCTEGDCLGGCDSIDFVADPSFPTDVGALTANYYGGEMHGDYQRIVWFVTMAGDSLQLRRARINSDNPCVARDATCGDLVADGVDALQVRVMQWEDGAADWVDHTGDTELEGAARVRLDVELVMRGEVSSSKRLHPPVRLEGSADCIPNCSTGDHTPRSVLRTSVDVRNSGKLFLK